MEINPFQLKLITEAAAQLAALSALIKTGKVKPYLNKSEAFKAFGRATVDRFEIELLAKSIIISKLN